MLDPFEIESEEYSYLQRYQDFRHVFLSAEGRRVLAEIVRLAEMRKPSAFPRYETNETFYRDGAKGIVFKIFDVLNTEPDMERPIRRK
jgi:hypothetical protein